jgi:hypothetical protein
MVIQLLSLPAEVRIDMVVAAVLGALVVLCLLLAMVETPPHVGR